MKKITISLNPTFLCNFRCDFCYLSKEQLADPKIIDSDVLFSKLAHISSRREIAHVDIYGGEISAMPDHKALEIFSIVKMYFSGKLNLITNFSSVPDYYYRDDMEISVSWDYFARARYEEVYKNMQNFKKPLHILMLASDKLLETNSDTIQEIIRKLNDIPMLVSLEIKPYSQSNFNNRKNDFLGYENWLQKWIDFRKEMKFRFINIDRIIESHKKEYSSWSNDHLYLQPDGNLSVLDFTGEGKEYFLNVDSIDEYETWCENENHTFRSDIICGGCKYLGHCLSEHLQKVHDVDSSCSGFYNLLEKNIGLR